MLSVKTVVDNSNDLQMGYFVKMVNSILCVWVQTINAVVKQNGKE
jgi:hypothetical protein